MRNHKDCKRGYYRSHKSFYANSQRKPSLTIGMYAEDNSTSGEFLIEWEQLGKNLVPKLAAYDDSWSALNQFKDLMVEMAKLDDKNITEPEFCEILNKLEIIDRTKYKEPDTKEHHNMKKGDTKTFYNYGELHEFAEKYHPESSEFKMDFNGTSEITITKL